MGMLYKRKKRDPQTGKVVEMAVWWIKYYDHGRPIRESTQTTDKATAKRKLQQREYEISTGVHQGSQAVANAE